MNTTKSSTISTSNLSICENCWLDKFSSTRKCSSESTDKTFFKKEAEEYGKGTYLIKNGDCVSGIYCVQKGFVKITKKGKRNKEFILWIAGQGDIIGLNTFINNENYAFSATAIDKISACFIPRSYLEILLKNEPMAFVHLMRKLCEKLNFVEQRITSLTGKSIRGQCAEILISIATPSGSEGDKKMYINYSVKDLASLVGTTRNYLYKILLELTNKQILSVHNRKFVINKMNELSIIANGSEK